MLDLTGKANKRVEFREAYHGQKSQSTLRSRRKMDNNPLHTMDDRDNSPRPNGEKIRFRTNESVDLLKGTNTIKVLDLQSVQNAQNLSKLVSIKSRLDTSYQTELSPSQKPPSVWDQMANHDA